MFKKIACLILALIPFFLLINIIRAQENFSVDSTVTYNVEDNGTTSVTHNITLENNTTDFYPLSYSLNLQNIDAANISAIDSAGNPLETDVQKSGDTTTIKVTLTNSKAGKGAQTHFSISYDNGSFAVRTGEVWEVSIPRLSDQNSFRSYNVVLHIPASFGLEAYISPSPETSKSDASGRVYTFTKSDVLQTGITAGFGQFQVFSFNLSYHLQNPLATTGQTQIALPPDTAYQKVYLQNIDPKPSNITLDSEGNWLATYILTPRQRVDVTARGSVQIFASYRSFPKPSSQVLADDLKPTEYWQTNDPKITALAQQLKTPQAIYTYVSTTLKYDFARVQPNVTRLGAEGALANPTEAICTEYTDLFIAIARAAGIPAREIEGYAYTENPQLQPLSLVADVLHAWPEYYDNSKSAWIPVDPTWGSTTGGVDYFNKLDLRHFTFVAHGETNPDGGESDTMPYPPGSYKLGPNPQKDVYVSFGQLPDNRISTPTITLTPIRTLPFLSSIYSFRVTNPGPVALYNVYPTVYFDSTENSRDFISVLPPFANYQGSFNVPFSILGKGSPSIVEVSIGAVNAQISTNKTQVVINSLLVLSFLLILAILGILLRLKKIKIGRFFGKIGSLPAKIHAGFTKKPTQEPNRPKSI